MLRHTAASTDAATNATTDAATDATTGAAHDDVHDGGPDAEHDGVPDVVRNAVHDGVPETPCATLFTTAYPAPNCRAATPYTYTDAHTAAPYNMPCPTPC